VRLDEPGALGEVKFSVTDLSVSLAEDVLPFYALAKSDKLRLPQADEIHPSGPDSMHSVLLNGHERYLPGLEAQPRSDLKKKRYCIQTCGAFDWKQLSKTPDSSFVNSDSSDRVKFELNRAVLR
jgi:hypothetical protein